MLFRWRSYRFKDRLISTSWIWVTAVLALMSCGAGAQPTSYSISIQPGFNSIANHLIRGSNKLAEVIPNAPLGSELYKFDPTTQTYHPRATFTANGWLSPGPEMEFLQPGEGAFLSASQSGTITISGVANTQFPLPRQVVFEGLNFVSAHEPRSMNFVELFGFPPAHGDVVYMFDEPTAALPNLTPPTGASSIHKFIAPHGWNSLAPMFKRGRSAFVYLSRAPRIMAHPMSQILTAGQSVTLDVTMLTRGPFNYQWHWNDDELPGQTNSTLLISNIHFLQSGQYSVAVSNPFGETASRPAAIRVDSKPVIVEAPRSVLTTPGRNVDLRVRAVGTPTLKYQWFRDGQPLPTGTEPLLQIVADQTAEFYVQVTNRFGVAQSAAVSVGVNVPPKIEQEPVPVTIVARETATFNAVATGTAPLRYQWLRNGRKILDETNATLVIRDAHPTNSGVYQLTVANIAGVAHSAPAELNVIVPDIFLADNRLQAEEYQMPEFTGRGHNLQATNEPDEVHCGRPGGSSVWMRWVTKERGIVRFETSGSTFDTVMAAYTADASGQLTEVACDDDEGEYLGSRIHFAALPDTTYFIAIDGLDGARGKILLDWALEPTLEALPVILEHPRDQTAAFGQMVVFSIQASGNPTLYQWYRNGIEIPNAVESRLVLPAIRPEDLGFYHVDVFHDGRFARSRRALLQVALADMDTRLVDGFAVDKFADTLNRPPSFGGLRALSGLAFAPVLGYTGTQIFSTVGYGGEPGELSHCGIPGGASAWFAFIPAADGQLYLDTAGSSFNTVLAVYTGPGPTLDTLTPLICDNDSGPGTTSSLNFPAAAGTVYYIAVDGFNGVTGNAHLNYRLLVPMTLTRIIKTNDATCRLRVTATPSYPFTIQRCAGFQTWVTVLTTNSPTGTYEYRDTNAIAIRRFYRALQTP